MYIHIYTIYSSAAYYLLVTCENLPRDPYAGDKVTSNRAIAFFIRSFTSET